MPGVVLIHVYDEARDQRQSFSCDVATLLHSMRYFKGYLQGVDRAKDVEISVHCDIEVFGWLLAYAQQSSGASPAPPLANQTSGRSTLGPPGTGRSTLGPHSGGPPLHTPTSRPAAESSAGRLHPGGLSSPSSVLAASAAASAATAVLATGLQLPVEKVLPVLISSHFLQMDALCDECVRYLAAHLPASAAAHDLCALPSELFAKLVKVVSESVLEVARAGAHAGDGGRCVSVVNKLYKHRLEVLLKELRTTLLRCVTCGALFSAAERATLRCEQQGDAEGPLGSSTVAPVRPVPVRQHTADLSWRFQDYLAQLRAGSIPSGASAAGGLPSVGRVGGGPMSWRDIYWHVWGRTAVLYCQHCLRYFPADELLLCSCHSSEPIFLSGSAAGRYPCCNVLAMRNGVIRCYSPGCCTHEHTVLPPPAAAAAGARRSSSAARLAVLDAAAMLPPAMVATYRMLQAFQHLVIGGPAPPGRRRASLSVAAAAAAALMAAGAPGGAGMDPPRSPSPTMMNSQRRGGPAGPTRGALEDGAAYRRSVSYGDDDLPATSHLRLAERPATAGAGPSTTPPPLAVSARPSSAAAPAPVTHPSGSPRGAGGQRPAAHQGSPRLSVVPLSGLRSINYAFPPDASPASDAKDPGADGGGASRAGGTGGTTVGRKLRMELLHEDDLARMDMLVQHLMQCRPPSRGMPSGKGSGSAAGGGPPVRSGSALRPASVYRTLSSNLRSRSSNGSGGAAAGGAAGGGGNPPFGSSQHSGNGYYRGRAAAGTAGGGEPSEPAGGSAPLRPSSVPRGSRTSMYNPRLAIFR